MEERIAIIKNDNGGVIGEYYRIEDDEDVYWELRIPNTETIRGEMRESPESIEKSVREFFESVSYLNSDSEINVEMDT